jgi:cytochrome c biogenesis protein CcmG, thiol:disulfide interchange protein DsbE
MRHLALALVLMAGMTAGGADAAPAAPGFTVTLLDSRARFDSREHIGKDIVIVRFQASWCRPCVKEAAALRRLADRYRSRGVELIAVHVQDTATDVRRFVKAHRATYKIALDPRLTVANRFGFKGTPDTVVIDRRGEIAARLTGQSAVARLPRVLDALLAGPPARR